MIFYEDLCLYSFWLLSMIILNNIFVGICYAMHFTFTEKNLKEKNRINFDVEENTRQMDWIQSKEEEKRISASNKHEYVCI